ncbi:hypothetical protein [Endozoicomonas atrinae]|uniref:hypothetical protein n=1 Tax=Endozoicomonas atrinae TaxID=1333660 RepID=UPI003B00A59D
MDERVYVVSFGTNQFLLNKLEDAVALLNLVTDAQAVVETFQDGKFVIKHSAYNSHADLKVRYLSDIDGDHL